MDQQPDKKNAFVDAYGPSLSLDELLARRLQTHGQSVAKHREELDKHRSWLLRDVRGPDVLKQDVDVPVDALYTQPQFTAKMIIGANAEREWRRHNNSTGGSDGSHKASSDTVAVAASPEVVAARIHRESQKMHTNSVTKPDPVTSPNFLRRRGMLADDTSSRWSPPRLNYDPTNSSSSRGGEPQMTMDEKIKVAVDSATNALQLAADAEPKGDVPMAKLPSADQHTAAPASSSAASRFQVLESERLQRLQRLRDEANQARALKVEQEALLVNRTCSPPPRSSKGHTGVRSSMERAARRQAMIESLRHEQVDHELADVTFKPEISTYSEALAQRRRQRDGVDNVDIAVSLAMRQSKADAEKWLRLQHLHHTEVPGHPQTTRTGSATGNHRSSDEDVFQRLHQASRRSDLTHELRDLVADGVEGGPDRCAPNSFSPSITPLAARLRRKSGHTAGHDLHELAAQSQKHKTQLAEFFKKEERMMAPGRPQVNPVSDAIASRLGEGSYQRLTKRVATKHEVDAAQSSTAASAASFRPAVNKRSQCIVERAREAKSNATEATSMQDQLRMKFELGEKEKPSRSSSCSTGQSHRDTFSDLHHDAHRREHRLNRLKTQIEAKQLDECTFAPDRAAVHGWKWRPSENGGPSTDAALREQHGVRRGGVVGQSLSYETQMAPPLLARLERWEQRRHQRMSEAADTAKAKALEECTFHPIVNDDAAARGREYDDVSEAPRHAELSLFAAPARGEASSPMRPSTTTPRSADASIYGGDGKAWGFHEHIERQAAARNLEAERLQHEQEVFDVARRWRGGVTKPEPFQLHSAKASKKTLSVVTPAAQSLPTDHNNAANHRDLSLSDLIQAHYRGDTRELPEHLRSTIRDIEDTHRPSGGHMPVDPSSPHRVRLPTAAVLAALPQTSQPASAFATQREVLPSFAGVSDRVLERAQSALSRAKEISLRV